MSEHESPIKTPKQLIIVVALSFIVPIVAIVLLTMYIGAAPMIGAGSDALSHPRPLHNASSPLVEWSRRPRRVQLSQQRLQALWSSELAARSMLQHVPGATPLASWGRPNSATKPPGRLVWQKAMRPCSPPRSRARVPWVRKAVAHTPTRKLARRLRIWPTVPAAISPNKTIDSLLWP